jgi:hypothetical protein
LRHYEDEDEEEEEEASQVDVEEASLGVIISDSRLVLVWVDAEWGNINRLTVVMHGGGPN